jgi:rSAM/selenodomain-associated transferase 1
MPAASSEPTPEKNPRRSRRLIVFARAPVAGRCKTRLIPQLGARGAAAIHRRLTLKTLSTASHSGVRTELCCEPDSRHGFFLRCRRERSLTLRRQARGDLGRKMALALKTALNHCDSAVIVGTDCPALTVSDIEAAFSALETGADYVLQPALDGGYVLIGARRVAPAALRGVSWSSGMELRQTLTRLGRLGLSYRLLPPRWDVDYPKDLRKARRLHLI